MKARISDIEILRAFAVLLVVLHHMHDNLIAWNNWAFDRLALYFGGNVGVDLFFVVSGFVIARDLLPRLSVGANNKNLFRVTLAFWVRRAWRLLPSAWLWLLLILIAVFFFNESKAFGTRSANLEATVAGIFQFANFRFLSKLAAGTEYGASFVYWSLSLEEQFYIVFPLIAIVFRKWLPPLLIAGILLPLIFPGNVISKHFRVDGLMLGVLIAFWSQLPSYCLAMPKFFQRIYGRGTIFLVLILVGMGISRSDYLSAYLSSYRLSLVAILSAVLVWLASYNENLFFKDSPLKTALLWIGSRSYGIYLIHVPIYFFTRELFFRFAPGSSLSDEMLLPLLIFAMILIAIVSEVNYRLIERPLRAHGVRVSDKILSVPLVGGANVKSDANQVIAKDVPVAQG